MSEDRAAIEAAVQLYLDGLYEGDADKLAATFHETSHLTYENGGKVAIMSRDEWFAIVRGRASPKAQGLSRHDEILLIDQSSPTTALVKVKCAIPPRFFTDYLSFLKVDGSWRVAEKVFSVRTDEGARAS